MDAPAAKALPTGLRVLVTDAEANATLAIVRSLGRAGCHVAATGHSRAPQAFFSRYCRQRFRVCPGHRNLEAFAQAIQRIVSSEQFDVLLPVGDAATLALSRYRTDVEKHVRLPIAEHEAVRLAYDKKAVVALGAECGLAVPATESPENLDELDAVASRIAYPVVVKPRKSAGTRGLWYARSAEELRAGYRFDDVSNDVVDFTAPLIQEYIPGDVHDACMLFERGKLRAALTMRRLWVYPLTGGWTVVSETTDEPDLVELAGRLLERLQWHGVAEVEFKRDSRDNRPTLMEINGRFWGSLQQSISAGMDFPRLLCDLALGEDSAAAPTYRKGFRFIRCDKGLVGNLVQRRPRLQALRDLRALARSPSVTNLCWRDPLPHLLELPRGIYRAVRAQRDSAR